jgi:hypothetical protein
MKILKELLTEEPAGNKPKTASDTTRERQKREKQQLQIRQARELAAAREQDFKRKESEKRAAEQKKLAQQRITASEALELDFGPENKNVYEYLEDGTFDLVKNYKKVVPGQDI